MEPLHLGSLGLELEVRESDYSVGSFLFLTSDWCDLPPQALISQLFCIVFGVSGQMVVGKPKFCGCRPVIVHASQCLFSGGAVGELLFLL